MRSAGGWKLGKDKGTGLQLTCGSGIFPLFERSKGGICSEVEFECRMFIYICILMGDLGPVFGINFILLWSK